MGYGGTGLVVDGDLLDRRYTRRAGGVEDHRLLPAVRRAQMDGGAEGAASYPDALDTRQPGSDATAPGGDEAPPSEGSGTTVRPP